MDGLDEDLFLSSSGSEDSWNENGVFGRDGRRKKMAYRGNRDNVHGSVNDSDDGASNNSESDDSHNSDIGSDDIGSIDSESDDSESDDSESDDSHNSDIGSDDIGSVDSESDDSESDDSKSDDGDNSDTEGDDNESNGIDSKYKNKRKTDHIVTRDESSQESLPKKGKWTTSRSPKNKGWTAAKHIDIEEGACRPKEDTDNNVEEQEKGNGEGYSQVEPPSKKLKYSILTSNRNVNGDEVEKEKVGASVLKNGTDAGYTNSDGNGGVFGCTLQGGKARRGGWPGGAAAAAAAAYSLSSGFKEKGEDKTSGVKNDDDADYVDSDSDDSDDEDDKDDEDDEEEDDDEYDPDSVHVVGCPLNGGEARLPGLERHRGGLTGGAVAADSLSSNFKEGGAKDVNYSKNSAGDSEFREEFVSLPSKVLNVDECIIPEGVLSVFSKLLKRGRFQFSQSVSFLRIIRREANSAMNSAFSSLLTNSGIRVPGDSVLCNSFEEPEKTYTTMSRVAKILADIAASSNPDNNFSPAASLLQGANNKTCSGRMTTSPGESMYRGGQNDRSVNGGSGKCGNRHGRITGSAAANVYQGSNIGGGNVSKRLARMPIDPKVWNKVIFYREIHSVISLYLSLVYIQRTMNNDNTNSSGYAEGMVSKILNIIGKIPHEEMSREKYVSVGRDALYLYQNVITDMTGPKHYKRLRIPQQQADFCYIIAMLVNDVPVASDLSLAGKATNLVQFASAMVDPAYRLAVHKMSCVFNSSYSVYKVLGLEQEMLLRANSILAMLSTKDKSLNERKPRTVTQSVFLYLRPSLKDKLRSSGLTSEESSLGTAVKLVTQQLNYEGVTPSSIDDSCSIIRGSYENRRGVTLKCLGAGTKDVKIVGLATLITDRLRKRRDSLPFY